MRPDALKAFHAFEHRFVWQARTAVIVVGLTGFYMVARLDLWARFHATEFWWMHAMVCVWLLFAFILFVAEPLILHRRFDQWAASQPDRALARLQRAHWVLLALGVITPSETSFTSAQNQRMTGSFIRKADSMTVEVKWTSGKGGSSIVSR